MPSPLPRQVQWSLFARLSPLPAAFPLGSCNCFFGACSAFTHVTACTLAESPSDPLHRKLRQLRCLRCRLDCYRVERTSSRAGVAPAEVQRLSRRTISPTSDARILSYAQVNESRGQVTRKRRRKSRELRGYPRVPGYRGWRRTGAWGRQRHARLRVTAHRVSESTVAVETAVLFEGFPSCEAGRAYSK